MFKGKRLNFDFSFVRVTPRRTNIKLFLSDNSASLL